MIKYFNDGELKQLPYNIIYLFSPCILLNSAGIWKTNMWYNQEIFKYFFVYYWIFEYFRVFASFCRMAAIRQILQSNHGIPWLAEDLSIFSIGRRINKIICKRKRVFRYFVNNITTADVTSALA